jgi:purine-binding chemotaxis protein CheW
MPGIPAGSETVVLVVRTGKRHCALRVAHVIETMRPLPLEPMADSPPFLLGLSIIRGAPVPVVALARVLGDLEDGSFSRFVSLRVDARCVALAVEEVVDVRALRDTSLEGLPPLLEEKAGVTEAIGILDSQLLLLLRTARIIPDAVWNRLEGRP